MSSICYILQKNLIPHDIIGNPIFVVIWCAVRDLDAHVINIAKALKALNGLKHVSHNFLLE